MKKNFCLEQPSCKDKYADETEDPNNMLLLLEIQNQIKAFNTRGICPNNRSKKQPA